MPPRRSRRIAQEASEEADSQPNSQPRVQQEVPPQAPAPAVPNMEGFFQAFQAFLERPPQPPPPPVIVPAPAPIPAPVSYLEKFLKLAPLPFKGERDPDIAESWLMELEKKFQVMKCPEEEKARLAAYMLQGPAAIWWESLKRTILADYGEIDWETFLDAFQEKYFPMHVRDAKESEFLALEQGQRSVADYEAKFSELGRYAPQVWVDERRRTRKFVKGLRGPIRRYVAIQDPSSFATALRLAHLAEEENIR
jgi:hypothetical protein